MAYKDSSEIATNSNYALGDYSFRIERSSVPGSANDSITAICTKGGKNARKSIQIPSRANIANWYVEANETEASVYISTTGDGGGINAVLVSCGVETKRYPQADDPWAGRMYIPGYSLGTDNQGIEATVSKGSAGADYVTTYNGRVFAANVSGSREWDKASLLDAGWTFTAGTTSRSGENGIFSEVSNYWTSISGIPASTINPEGKPYSIEDKEYLVGRFAIDIEDAGGVGPGSDWTDPGDYDPDWEPEDPTHTLYVTVTGALSGRHNDPIVDPSYSYIPADKDTIKDYGCGGDGGHGGGGGAGASTVVIHKFATNQANSKEVTAIARRHGYGSGGGKGGKGGDGCILVYY